jgi:hypothetical protein
LKTKSSKQKNVLHNKTGEAVVKIVNFLLIAIITILLIASITALIATHWSLANEYAFNLSPLGINRYLSELGDYKSLLTGTIATIVAYFGMLRLKVATEANIDKVKNDRFLEWKTVLEVRCVEVENQDPLMRREFTRIRYNLFTQLFAQKFIISNQSDLKNIFENHFLNIADFFDTNNTRYINNGGIYPSTNYSYSFDHFRFIFMGTIDSFYDDLVKDLEILYISALSKSRIIDKAMFSQI